MANPNPNDISSRINLIAGITPADQASQYPTHFADFGAGGLRRVDGISGSSATDTYRNDITRDRRELGMLVFVESDSKYYQLITEPGTDATTDADWQEFDSGGGTGTITSVTVDSPTSPIVATTADGDVVLSAPSLPIVFSNDRSYAPDLEVFFAGRLYRSRNFITAPTAPAVLTDPSGDLFNWQGIEAIAQWDVTRGNGQPNPYGTDDQVWFNERIYIYTGNGVSNRNPTADPTDWSLPATTASAGPTVYVESAVVNNFNNRAVFTDATGTETDLIAPQFLPDAPVNPTSVEQGYTLQRRSNVTSQAGLLLTFPPGSVSFTADNSVLQLKAFDDVDVAQLGSLMVSGPQTTEAGETDWAFADTPDTAIPALSTPVLGRPIIEIITRTPITPDLTTRAFILAATQSDFIDDYVIVQNLYFERTGRRTRAIRLSDVSNAGAIVESQRVLFLATDTNIDYPDNTVSSQTNSFSSMAPSNFVSAEDRTVWTEIGDELNIQNFGSAANNGERILVPGAKISAKRLKAGDGINVVTQTNAVNGVEEILIESDGRFEYNIVNTSSAAIPAGSIIDFNEDTFNRTTGIVTVTDSLPAIVNGQSHCLFIENEIGTSTMSAFGNIVIDGPASIPTPADGIIRVNVVNNIHPTGISAQLGISKVSSLLEFRAALVTAWNANPELSEMYLAVPGSSGGGQLFDLSGVQNGERYNTIGTGITLTNVYNSLPYTFDGQRSNSFQVSGGDINIGEGVLYGIVDVTTTLESVTEDIDFSVRRTSTDPNLPAFVGQIFTPSTANPFLAGEHILGQLLKNTDASAPTPGRRRYTFDGLSNAEQPTASMIDPLVAPIVITPPIETGQEIVAVETPNSIRFNFSSPPAGFIQNRINFGTLSGIASFNGEGGVSYAFLNGPNGDTDPTNFGPTFSRVINTGSGVDFVNAIFTDANPINDYTLTSSIDTFRTVFTNTPGFANWTNNGNGNFTVSFRDDVDVNAISVQGPQLTIVARNTGGVTTWRNTANVDQTGIFATNGTTAVIPKHSFVFVTPAFASNGVHNITGVVSTSESNLYQDVYVTTEDVPVSSTEPVFIVSSGIIRDFELPTTGNTATANTGNLLRYIDIRKFWTQDDAEGNGSGFGGNGDGRVPPANPVTAQVIGRSGSTSNLWTIKKYDSTKIGGIVNQPDLARIFTAENNISGVGPAGASSLTYEGNSGIQSTLGSLFVGPAGGIELQQPFGDVFIKRNWAFHNDGVSAITGGFTRTDDADFTPNIYPPLHLEPTGQTGDTRTGFDTHDTRFWSNTSRFGPIGYYQPVDLSPVGRNASVGISAFMDVIFNVRFTDIGDATQGTVTIAFDYLYHRGTAGFENFILANGAVSRGTQAFSVDATGTNFRMRLNTGYTRDTGGQPNFPGYYGGFNVTNATNPSNAFGQTIHIHDPTNFGLRWVYNWFTPSGTPPVITAVPVGEYYGNTTTNSDFRIPYSACATIKRLW